MTTDANQSLASVLLFKLLVAQAGSMIRVCIGLFSLGFTLFVGGEHGVEKI